MNENNAQRFDFFGATRLTTDRLRETDTLRAVVARIARIMRAETVSVASFTPARRAHGDALVWRAATQTEPDETIAEQLDELTALLDAEMLAQIAAGEQMVIIANAPDRAPDERAERNFLLQRIPISSYMPLLLVPLSARGEVIGILALRSNDAHNLSDEDRATLANLTDLAALALDNVLLFETVSRAEKVWEQTFDAIPDGIIVCDDHLQLARCNLRAAQLLGLSAPQEAIGLARSEIFTRLFGARTAAYHVAPSGGAVSSFELQAESGGRYLIAIAPLDTIADERTWSVMTWSDITELAQMQEQLARSRRLAMIGQLAAGVAHEINNPLAAITTCAETMTLDMSENAALAETAGALDWNFYLQEIVRQALRGKGITRGLLDLARSRRAELRACDINALIAHSVKIYEQRARPKIKIVTELDARLRATLADEAMLGQVLDNLLSNALDAIADAEHAQVSVRTSLEGALCAIEVADTGCGIPADLLARIFEPFYTTKEVGKGSGLGLSIATTLAENLGGALGVQSKEGSGSSFRLTIPYRPVDAHDMAVDA